MLVWRDGFSGTIGGGTLEHQALQAARSALESRSRYFSRQALGPDLGQCCGGSVDLFFETFDLNAAQSLSDTLIVRGPGDMPLEVARILAAHRDFATLPAPKRIGDWMVEPVSTPDRPVWVWGAGHVGRALISALCPLPQFHMTWVDTDTSRFPAAVSESVETIATPHPDRLVHYAPTKAAHLIVTYSHDLDLALCHHLLGHGFSFAGLIGSATKWARFRSRLAKMGHALQTIDRITCPIGDPSLGKHPQAIALGVAADLLRDEVPAAQKGYG